MGGKKGVYKTTDETLLRVYKCFSENKEQATNILKISLETISRYLTEARNRGLIDREDRSGYVTGLKRSKSKVEITNKEIKSEDKDQMKQKIKHLLKTGTYTIEEISDKLLILPKDIRLILTELTDEKFLLQQNNDEVSIIEKPNIGSKSTLNENMWRGDIIKFGFTADNHLCSHFERLDVLNLIYDLCEGEGVSTVLNGGNWIDGEARFNKNEIHTKGMTKQIEYAVKNYPHRKGIETWFVSGDDHEGWYTQRESVNIGEYFQMKREQAGLFDMKHLGYVEADIELNQGGFENNAWMRVMHAGGGSAYATSYSAQKIVESLQGGEKPNILFIGHYHKLLYAYTRNVHTIQMGCFVASTWIDTIEGRKKIKDIKVGDFVLTHKNRFRKVTKLFNYHYKGGFTTLLFGRKSGFNRFTATDEHPVLVDRNGIVDWIEVKNIKKGDYIFVSTKKCPHCDNLIPYWMNYCKDYNCMSKKEIRDKISENRGGFKRVRKGKNNSSGSIHLHKDIIPFCDKKIEEGWKMIPVGAEIIPDAVGFKDGKIVLFEVERQKGNFLEFKQEKYINSYINNYVDDIEWVIIKDYKGRSRGNDYKITEYGLAKVKVIETIHKNSYFEKDKRNRDNIKVYNFSVEEDESYIASHVAVHNCTQDQSIFMRKQKIEAHVGGGIITLRRAKDGTINRCSVDFITAFDKKFYIGKDKYLK